jgi:hypothetical protein
MKKPTGRKTKGPSQLQGLIPRRPGLRALLGPTSLPAVEPKKPPPWKPTQKPKDNA